MQCCEFIPIEPGEGLTLVLVLQKDGNYDLEMDTNFGDATDLFLPGTSQENIDKKSELAHLSSQPRLRYAMLDHQEILWVRVKEAPFSRILTVTRLGIFLKMGLLSL